LATLIQTYTAMLLYKDFSFDAAHYLTKVPANHKCAVMHGHTYHLRVWIKGTINEAGWVMDFAELKAAVQDTLAKIDHQCLNQIIDLENPTCEILAMWIWKNIKPSLPLLHKITLQETPTSGVEYCGD